MLTASHAWIIQPLQLSSCPVQSCWLSLSSAKLQFSLSRISESYQPLARSAGLFWASAILFSIVLCTRLFQLLRLNSYSVDTSRSLYGLSITVVFSSLAEPMIDVHHALAMASSFLSFARFSGYFTHSCCSFSRQHFAAYSIYLSILSGDTGQVCRAQESIEEAGIAF